MAGALRKTMVYLGLAEEDEQLEGYESSTGATAHGSHLDPARESVREREEAPVRPVVESPAPAREERPVRAVPTERRGEVAQFPTRTPAARVAKEQELGPLNRITTIHPRTYNEAKTIGESFREGTPVIMNLSDMADDDAKRLVDFAAGLVFGLAGTIERVTSKVFLLSPAHVEVESDNPQAATGKSLFNQS